MFNGKVVKTGACTSDVNYNPKDFKNKDNQSSSYNLKKCKTTKKFYVVKPSPKINSQNDINQIENRNSKKNSMDLYKNL